MRIMKIIKIVVFSENLKIPLENHKNHEDPTIPSENHANHRKLYYSTREL